MAKRLGRVSFGLGAGMALAVTAFLPCPRLEAQGRGRVLFPVTAWVGSHKKTEGSQAPPPVRATEQPALTIPIEPLGFTAPAQFYLGLRYSLASLDFFDENHLLLTFRVPGLIHRDLTHRDPNGPDPSEERQVRALVLQLPQGIVQAEAVWTLHDRRRYLWMLDNGQFLLRDRENLQLGNASLQLKPYLHFPGPVLWVEMDPRYQYMVTGSSEPAVSAAKSGDVGSPAGAAATLVSDDPKPDPEPDLVLRILRRDTGKVMLVSRVHSAVHLPINDDGYLDTLRGDGRSWLVNFNYFSGGSKILGKVDSFCSPDLDFVSPVEFLATTCNSNGDTRLVAMTTSGRRLWDAGIPGSYVWPHLVTGTNGLRIARESLSTSHSVNAFSPLGTDDIKGQDVEVFDSANGKLVLRALASPVFDAGGNVAVSPSGRKVAIVMADGIQIFDLGDPAPLPDEKGKSPGH